MNNDIEELKIYVTKLRTDLTATNLLLIAMHGAMTPEQQQQVLQAVAGLSVMQEQTAEQAQKPEAIAQLQQSIQRLYTALLGAQKLRAGG
ncbi:MAG: hypothetical protein Q7K57_51840 [Burkholderiaceae bacterium]|nr:hypothetical protein [Burkholderiaceae bacterium]